MSSALSIAALSAVLKSVLEETILDPSLNLTSILGQEVAVTVRPPDQAIADSDGGPGVNIFMYRVAKNPGWANVDLPEFDGKNRRTSHPPLALNLHYILTAFGGADFQSDILLGYAMQALNEYRILPRALITQKLGELGPGDPLATVFSAMAEAGLARQPESIKISLETLELDEISKIWSSLQAKYRPSAYYQASVVLIKPEREFSEGPIVSEIRTKTQVGITKEEAGE